MPSDRQQASGGYLQGVLLDGARPFRYRGGVRSLLGMPDGEGGNLASWPTLPVGFRYEFGGQSYLPPQRPPGEALRSALDSEPWVGLEGWPGVVQENIQSNVSGLPDAPPGLPNPAENGRFSNPPRAVRMERLSLETPGASDAPAGLPNPAENGRLDNPPRTSRVERVSLEIPGVSQRQAFLALSQDNRSATPSEHGNTGQSERRLSSAAYRNQAASPGKELTPEGRLASIHPSPTLQGTQPALPPERLPEKRHGVEPAQTAGAFIPKPVGADTANRSNRDAADRIEQLRQAVHQLAAKVSSPPARTDHQAKQRQPEQPPPPPAQPVVIIRQAARQARTPRAFWERSYLGRFRLRTWR